MMLSYDEAEEVKKKLIEQVKSTFPPDKIDSAVQQIESMNPEQLEVFLEKNNLIKKDGSESNCVFCSIASDKIQSVKLGEDKSAVAVLDINPISKGHLIVIPKKHEANADDAEELAGEISKKIQEKFKPKHILSSRTKLFGHEIINLLPVYDHEDFNSERSHASMEELESVKDELEKEIQEEIKRPIIEKLAEFSWLPKRLP